MCLLVVAMIMQLASVSFAAISTTNNNAAAYQSYGFTRETYGDGYFKIVRNSDIVNSSTNMYWKDVDAGELVSVPNDKEASNSYTILIKYADYE